MLRPEPAIPLLTADNESRAAQLADDPRGDDSNHADVPQELGLYNYVVGVRIESRAQAAGDLLGHVPLDLLALAVLRVQFVRDGLRGGHAARAEQMQGAFGIFQPASGV
jgi:hypothetical protein